MYCQIVLFEALDKDKFHHQVITDGIIYLLKVSFDEDLLNFVNGGF